MHRTRKNQGRYTTLPVQAVLKCFSFGKKEKKLLVYCFLISDSPYCRAYSNQALNMSFEMPIRQPPEKNVSISSLPARATLGQIARPVGSSSASANVQSKAVYFLLSRVTPSTQWQLEFFE